MPAYLVSMLSWVVGQALQHVTPEDAKDGVAKLFVQLDKLVQEADKSVEGPFKGIADQVALEFHEACVAIETALAKK